MDLNQPIGVKKNNFGLTVLIGSILVFLFGGSGLLAIVVETIIIVSAVLSFKKEGGNPKSKYMTLVGLVILGCAVLLAYVFNWHGPVYEFLLKNYLVA